MNPTDEVDDLLTRAGARWRADQPSPPEPDLDRILNGRRRPRRLVPALAAASVAAIAATALTVLPNGAKDPAGTSDPSQSVAQGNQAPYDELLVHDGDRVQVGGQVIAAPGQEPVFCPPGVPTQGLDPGFGPRGSEPAPACPAQYAVTLKGFDPNKLGEAKTIQGVRTGYTQLIGTWTGRTIEVQEQTMPQARSTTAELNLPPDEVPCPTPAGGWSTKPTDIDKVAISRFLDARRDQITGPRLLYPKGGATRAPEVMTIGVAHGDLAAVRRAFAKVYDGNMCVHHVKLSQADHTRIGTAVGKLIPNGLGVYGGAVTSDVDKVGVSALVYDEALKTALTPIGLENLELKVAVKPLR